MFLNTKRWKLLFIYILFLLLPALQIKAEWPRWRGPNGDGISDETGWNPEALAQGPKILWKFNTGPSSSNVAILGNHVYTMGRDAKYNEVVFCLDSESGKVIWRYSCQCIGGPYGPQTTPTVDGDFVYTLSFKGDLHCLNTRKGKLQWHKQLVDEYKIVPPFYGFSGSPVVEGNLLIITGNSHGIALNKNNGNLVWTSPPCKGEFGRDQSGSEYATPVLYTQNGKRYALVFNTFELSAVDVETGTPNWYHRWPSEQNPRWAHAADPVYFDKKVFISSYGYSYPEIGCALIDIGPAKPKVVWQNKNMSNYFSTCVLMNGHLYGCHGNVTGGEGILRCLDVKNGKVVWEKDFEEPLGLSAANGMLLILTERGRLHIAEASPRSYKEISSAQVIEIKGAMNPHCWTPPVLCGGRIYCHDQYGNLVCIDMRK